jgi:hypothetical protein
MFYDLRPLLARLQARYRPSRLAALRAAVLRPLELRCAARRLTVVNPDRSTHTATLSATVGGGSGILIRIGDGRRIPVSPGSIRLGLSLRPGSTTIALSARAGASRAPSLFAPTVTDTAFAPFGTAATASVRTGIIGPPCASVST